MGIYRVLRTELFVSKILIFFCLGSAGLASTSIGGAGGLTIGVDPGGTYEVSVPDLNWRFLGTIGVPLSNLTTTAGGDAVGAYAEISFDFVSDAPRHAAIRSYGNVRAVLFTVSYPSAAPNTFSFPNWTQYPRNLDHLTYSGIFAPPTFSSFSSESPWIFFDSSANTFILSAAANFMSASTAWGANGELASGIAPQIASLPQNFQHQTLLVMDRGINSAFESWGRTLTTLAGKSRPANDADTSLNRIGYWTDNGGTYYYKTAPSLSYEQTLQGIKADFDHLGIGLGYVQLDSWFYPKGTSGVWNDGSGGIYQYTASPTLFPNSLSAFQQSLGASLITHARWIDPNSPYRQLYRMSGNVVLDRAYWDAVATYLVNSGVSTYEQDWLDDKAQPNFNLNDAETFLTNMAGAMAEHGLTMQYCMPSPRHFLQSTRYDNLTTIRTSEDRFGPARWNNFLFTSRLASALGIWPFTDVFLSTESENLLLATLSAGPVGVGDPMGAGNGAVLSRAVRSDGVIVKPDTPLVPLDRSYRNAAHGLNTPLIAAAYSDFGDLTAHYVLAYAQGSNLQAEFSPGEIGLAGPAYFYDYFSGAGQVRNATDLIATPIARNLLYLVAAPIGPSGMAVIGDLGQFVPLGKKRIPSLTDNGRIHLTVAFSAGETSREITGYSPVRPEIKALSGAVASLAYDANHQQFRVTVMPGSDGKATLRIRKPRTIIRPAPIRPTPAAR